MRLISKISVAVRMALALFFLLSGLGKMLDILQFTRTIVAYGLPQLQPLAPVLVALEIGLGVALLLGVYPRAAALLSLGLLAVFTALFAYGHWAHGVASCGCFGALEVGQVPAGFSFARNGLLMGFAYWLYQASPRHAPPVAALNLRLALGAAALTFGLTGSAYANRYANRYASAPAAVRPGQLLRTSLLAPYLPAGSDSTYVVFVYSAACVHCGEVTPTVASYRTSGLVARVVALHPPLDAQQQQRYEQRFHPGFSQRTVARDSLYAITYQVPLAVVVRRGVVTHVLGPKMPTATALKALLANGPVAQR